MLADARATTMARRPARLAQTHLNAFAPGLTAARRLFARRRMGKTGFLRKDPLPAAVERGESALHPAAGIERIGAPIGKPARR